MTTSVAVEIVEVGMGATICHYSDRTAGTIVKISPNGKTIWIQEDQATLNPSFKPNFIPGGFFGTVVNQCEQKYSYKPNVNGEIWRAHLCVNGRWMIGGKRGERVMIGVRSKFYDYNF